MDAYRHLRERWRDPLLTVVTIALMLLMFVIAPLQAQGIGQAQELGFAIALVVIGAAVVWSGNPGAVAAMLLAFGLAAAAALLRQQGTSTLDVYLKASAWTLMGVALIWVVARVVFGPGVITYHRVMGAILLYLAIGWTFAGIFTFAGLVLHHAFDGMTVGDSAGLGSQMIYFSFGTLTTAGAGDMAPVAPLARSLVNIEAMIGQLYPATLLARLVTLEIEDEAKSKSKSKSKSKPKPK